jgi:hypothetical protein
VLRVGGWGIRDVWLRTHHGLYDGVGGPGGKGVCSRGGRAVAVRRRGGRGAVVSVSVLCAGESGGILETEGGHELDEGGERHAGKMENGG